MLFSFLKIFFWAKRVYNIVSRALCATREPRVVLASCKIGCPIFLSFFLSLNIAWFPPMTSFSITVMEQFCFQATYRLCRWWPGRPLVFYSWRADVFFHRWITSNFPCKWHRTPSTTSGCKSSPEKIFHRNSSGARTPTLSSASATKEKTLTRNYRAERQLERTSLSTAKATPTKTDRNRGTGDWAPTFFFPFSAADNYWPDLHRLLQMPNNAVPSVRIRAVIDNPHITDAYFVSRVDVFCTHWLDHEMDAEGEWLRFEWQARGMQYSCAWVCKLSNDPGLCNLVKTASQGWKLEQILRLYEQHPSYHPEV